MVQEAVGRMASELVQAPRALPGGREPGAMPLPIAEERATARGLFVVGRTADGPHVYLGLLHRARQAGRDTLYLSIPEAAFCK